MKKHRTMTLIVLFILILIDCLMRPTYRLLNPHDYVKGRDIPITTHNDTPDEPYPTTVVDSWYNTEHEFHKYDETRTKIEWLDLNKRWHTEKIFSINSDYIYFFELLILFGTYIYFKEQKQIKAPAI